MGFNYHIHYVTKDYLCKQFVEWYAVCVVGFVNRTIPLIGVYETYLMQLGHI